MHQLLWPNPKTFSVDTKGSNNRCTQTKKAHYTDCCVMSLFCFCVHNISTSSCNMLRVGGSVMVQIGPIIRNISSFCLSLRHCVHVTTLLSEVGEAQGAILTNTQPLWVHRSPCFRSGQLGGVWGGFCVRDCHGHLLCKTRSPPFSSCSSLSLGSCSTRYRNNVVFLTCRRVYIPSPPN